MRDIVAKCLMKDPGRRPTAAQLLEHKFFKARARRAARLRPSRRRGWPARRHPRPLPPRSRVCHASGARPAYLHSRPAGAGARGGFLPGRPAREHSCTAAGATLQRRCFPERCAAEHVLGTAAPAAERIVRSCQSSVQHCGTASCVWSVRVLGSRERCMQARAQPVLWLLPCTYCCLALSYSLSREYPCGLVVRISGFHPGDPGSNPGRGGALPFCFRHFFFAAMVHPREHACRSALPAPPQGVLCCACRRPPDARADGARPGLPGEAPAGGPAGRDHARAPDAAEPHDLRLQHGRRQVARDGGQQGGVRQGAPPAAAARCFLACAKRTRV